jgi:hypothetical protein
LAMVGGGPLEGARPSNLLTTAKTSTCDCDQPRS